MDNKVSVIIPMYNSEEFIEECISSVVNQTYKNLEIIVIDDCSEDSSFSIVDRIKDERIKLVKFQENKGVSIARNKGIDISTGDYIAFLDSDDVWVKDKIEKQIKFIKDNDYTFIYSNYAYLNEKLLHKLVDLDLKLENIQYESEKIKELKVTNVPSQLSYEQAIKNTTIFVSTVMFDMNKLKKEDIYMPNLKIGQDTATWWQVLKKGIKAYGMKDVLAFYRVGNLSLSSNKIRAVIGTWKIYLRESMRWYERLFCFMCYIKNAVNRRR